MEIPYQLVQELNQELYKKYKRDNIWFSYTLDNMIDAIAFNSFGENHNIKIELWNSENSQQIFNDDIEEYEPLRDTILRELKIAVKDLNNIKI